MLRSLGFKECFMLDCLFLYSLQRNVIILLFLFALELRGIHQQASVGFLTLMESLRYCKVGVYS